MYAHTRALPDGIDLNDVARGDGYLFVRSGVGFAGRGVAMRAPATTCDDVLRSMHHENESSFDVGPIALGVMPFDPSGSTELVIPEVTVGKNAEGQCWITTVGADAASPVDPATFIAPSPRADVAAFSIRQVTPIDVYLQAVMSARDAVRRGELTKAVIARAIEVTSTSPFDVHAVLLRLRTSFAQSYRYSIDGFIGASPELLLSVEGDRVTSHPLAGTVPRTGDPAADTKMAETLLASMKDQIEHRVVIDVIHDQLLPWCSYLDWEAEPSIVQVANVQHLGTRIEGRLNATRPSVFDMARTLCPTPALGGHPRRAALDLITTVEGRDRGRYGGSVGWIDSRGNGTWAVAIRCAELSADRTRAILCAGGGIVAESEPDVELVETQAKFQAMLSALVRA